MLNPYLDLLGATLEEPLRGVYLVRFDDRKVMGRTLMRLAEFKESPKFRGRPFHIKDFVAWYRTTRPHGRFSYCSDWDGYNFGIEDLRAFADAFLGWRLTKQELAFLRLFLPRSGSFCVIAMTGYDPEVEEHEIAHACYALDPHYRADVREALAGVDCKPLEAELAADGYGSAVFEDETQAYLATDPPGFTLDLKPYAETARKIRAALLASKGRLRFPE